MTTAKKTAAAAKAADQVEAAVTAGKETVETVVKASTDMATKSYEKAVAMTTEQVDAAVKAGTEAFKNYEELAAFNKENMDAVVKAGTTFAKGVQDINQVVIAFAQASIEDGVAATKAIFGSKSIQEVVEVQSNLARSSYDKFMTESRKVTDMSVKLAEQTAEPLTARVNVAVEKFTKPLAA